MAVRTLSVPRAKRPPQSDQLPEMIGIVIGHKQRLAQDGLASAPRNWCIEIGVRIGDQVLHRFQIGPEGRDAFVPSLDVRRLIVAWPVVVGKRQFLVFRIAAEVENVTLCDTHVLEQLPCRMRKFRRMLPAEFFRPVGNGSIEIGVRGAASEQLDQVLAKR